MNISAAGQKRVCAHCQARFFDLNRDPIICPTCQAVFVVPPPPPPRPVRAPRRFTPHAPVAVDPANDDSDLETEKDKDEESSGDVLILDEEDDSDGAPIDGAVVVDPEKRDRET